MIAHGIVRFLLYSSLSEQLQSVVQKLNNRYRSVLNKVRAFNSRREPSAGRYSSDCVFINRVPSSEGKTNYVFYCATWENWSTNTTFFLQCSGRCIELHITERMIVIN